MTDAETIAELRAEVDRLNAELRHAKAGDSWHMFRDWEAFAPPGGGTLEIHFVDLRAPKDPE